MAAQPRSRSAEALILRLARRQHGAISRHQLLAAGVTRNEVATRLRDGRLEQVHRGVYLVGGVPTPHAHEMAALLAGGRRSALSHRSATALWGLLAYPASAPVWLTIPPGRSATRPRLKAIRARLGDTDVRRRHGMPLTSPPRTLLDLAPLLSEGGLEHLVAEANYRRLATEAELRDQIDRNGGARGARTLRAVLDLPGGPKRTRSPAERQLLRLLRRNGVQGYETNAKVLGYEVDFLWSDLGFAVEVDGWDGHSGRVAFERDRLKLARLQAGGLRVMPVTGRQIRRDPTGVVQRLTAALDAARRGQGLGVS